MAERKQRKFLRSATSPGISSNSMGSPGSSSGGAIGGSGGDPELRRTTSAIARFTRSVSKLGSRRSRRGASELPAEVLNEESEFVVDERKSALNNKLSYETPIRRAETVPIRSAYQDVGRGGTSTTVDVAAFLRAVPDLLGVDASLSNVGAAVRSAENLARTLRASAADIDTTHPSSTTPPPSTTKEAEAFKFLEANRQWDRIHDAFEASVAEHRFEDAFTYWQELLQTLTSSSSGTSSNGSSGANERAWLLEIKCSECASFLVSFLQQQAASISKLGGGGGDGDGELKLQQVVVLLSQLVGVPAAVAAVLDASRARLRDHLESLPLGYQRAAAAGSGAAAEEATLDLAAALGQALAMGLATTANLVKSISNTESEAVVYGAFSDWVGTEVAFGCEVLRKSVVLPRAAPAGLATTTRCTAAFLAHFDALDTSVGVPVGQLAREGVWSAVEPVLQRRARQLCEGLRKAAATEAKAAANTSAKLPSMRDGRVVSWEELISVFPSAKRLTNEIAGMAAATTPVAGPTAVASVRSIITTAFMAFAESVAGTLTASSGQKSSPAVAEISMELATRLVEHVLAESTFALSAIGWGPAVDAAAMVAALEEMATTLKMDSVG